LKVAKSHWDWQLVVESNWKRLKAVESSYSWVNAEMDMP